MIDPTTPRGRLVAALMSLAANRDWSDLELIDIAREAGLTLADARQHFASKAAILAAFTRDMDDALATRMNVRLDRSEAPRDRLFDVVMTRFDLMMPYRPALKRISHTMGSAAVGLDPRVVPQVHRLLGVR